MAFSPEVFIVLSCSHLISFLTDCIKLNLLISPPLLCVFVAAGSELSPSVGGPLDHDAALCNACVPALSLAEDCKRPNSLEHLLIFSQARRALLEPTVVSAAGLCCLAWAVVRWLKWATRSGDIWGGSTLSFGAWAALSTEDTARAPSIL